MMRSRLVLVSMILAVLALYDSVGAAPVTPDEAILAVMGWLRLHPAPLGTPLGQEILTTAASTDDQGEALYYVVCLQPSGFVLVAPDDLVEPIIGFSGDGAYDPAADSPLSRLAGRDLRSRLAAVRTPHGDLSIAAQAEPTETQQKWSRLRAAGLTPAEMLHIAGLDSGSIDDMRVEPLIASKWGQGYVSQQPCYNYYTPNQYLAGCGAIALAQLLRYYRYPTAGIGVQQFTIKVDGVDQLASTRGGDGQGGPYRWDDMVSSPGFYTSEQQRKAIGALCSDAGVATKMSYASTGSISYGEDFHVALKSVFGYRNAIVSQYQGIDSALSGMITPNLDAKLPVLLSIADKDGQNGHFILCDGYGYNNSTLYRHLNMGWYGQDNLWYHLPDIDSTVHGPYSIVRRCVYNVFPSVSGEIISGRVTDLAGTPIPAVEVTATQSSSQQIRSAQTDAHGIYAMVGVDAQSTYVIHANKAGYEAAEKPVTVTKSVDDQAVAGNRWDVNFQLRGTSGQGTQLQNGVPVSNLSGSTSSERLFQLEVPAGSQTLEIKISGGTGDADLYVKRGSAPTTSSYDYRPYKVGNYETVAVANPTAGSWFILVRAYQAFSGVTLVATYSAGSVDPSQSGAVFINLAGNLVAIQPVPGSSLTYSGCVTVTIELNFRARLSIQVTAASPSYGSWSGRVTPDIVGPGNAQVEICIEGYNVQVPVVPPGSSLTVATVSLLAAPAN